MRTHVTDDFAGRIAERMRAEHRTLAARWLARLSELLPVEPNRVFPSDHLLDHIPSLIEEIATYLSQPERDEFAANTLVMTKARELGILRHQQQASVHQLLREFRILGAILTAFVQEEAEGSRLEASQAIALLTSLSRAVSVLEQATIEAFIGEYTETIAKQTMRLANFNRMVSHELRQPIGALQFALRLSETSDDDVERARYRDVIDRNLSRLVSLLDRLAQVSRIAAPNDTLHTQELDLGLVAREAARQLRDMADSRGVLVRVLEPFPVATVDVAALELVLVNLISNAIKYANPESSQRIVELAAEPSDGACTIVVRDNGIGIPPEHLPFVFDREYRAQPERDAELETAGQGLGLAIVRDCAADQSWTVEVESVLGEGTTFRITLPLVPPKPGGMP
jgi:signal transduction histidine kinase